jgi:hypothetical protein
MTTFDSTERALDARPDADDDEDSFWSQPRCYERSCSAEFFSFRDESGVCPACHAQWMSAVLNGSPQPLS